MKMKRPPPDVGAGSDCSYGTQRHWDVGRIRGVARGIPRGRAHLPLPPHLRLLVTRNLKLETWNPEPEARNPNPETRSSKSETW